jgi:DMSO reductase family type II enzyme heme b subunit
MRGRIPVVSLLAAFAIAAGAAALVPEVRARHVPGAASDPRDPAWDGVPAATLDLAEQMIVPPVGGGSVRQVEVRAMHDGEWLALRLVWADASADRAVGVDAFRDAAAVGFPVGEALPSPFMGDPEHPVAIWQWAADLDAEAAGRGDFAERYPATEGVWYFPQDAAVRREVTAWRGSEPVAAYTAVGFGTLARRATHEVRGSGRHAEGRWAVVLRRRLATADPAEPVFAPGTATQLIAAVWDGARREVNGRKSVTLMWIPFALDPEGDGDGRR